MAMRLWFENSNGEERVIKNNVNTWSEVDKAIDELIAQRNLNKTNERKRIYGADYNPSYDKPFVRYYTRVWRQGDGRTRIDVSSHTEFFIWEGQYQVGEQ